MLGSVYVGTYAKYNHGDLSGAWLDLDDYSDKEEFLAACKKLHADEEEPEFMIQDKEEVAFDDLVSESYVDGRIWAVALLIRLSIIGCLTTAGTSWRRGHITTMDAVQ
jgi:antirestriction protein